MPEEKDKKPPALFKGEAEVAPDTVLGFCTYCSTALLERDANRCRGCGRMCDPTSAVSVTTGVQMSAVASRNGMRPISWRLNLLALLAVVVLIWDARYPAAFPPSFSSRGVVLAAMAGGLWGLWSVLKMGLLMNYGLPVLHIFADWKKRIVVPLLLGLCFPLLVYELPFQVAFALSRSALQQEAEAALQAKTEKPEFTGAADWTSNGVRRVGLYWIDGVVRRSNEVRFYGYLPPQGLRHSQGRYYVFAKGTDPSDLPEKAKQADDEWWAW